MTRISATRSGTTQTDPPAAPRRGRLVLGTVLALAVLGFAADRLLLGGGQTGPQTAEAAPAWSPAAAGRTGAPSAGAPSPLAAPAADTTRSSPEREDSGSVDQRLAAAAARIRAARPEAGRHAFDARGPLAPRPAAAPPPVDAPFDPADFLSRHRVRAVITDASGAAALIGPRTVRVGHISEGMTLTEISERSVTWQGRGARIRDAVGLTSDR